MDRPTGGRPVAGPPMDAGEAGGGVAAAAAASDPRGLVRAVLRCSSSPLFFWLLAVALVAAIHVASVLVSSRNEEKEREKRKPRRGGFTAGEEGEVAERDDDRILEMMRGFSFVQATEEDFLEGVAAFGHVATGEETQPDAPSTFSFKFQHQMQGIPREAAVVSRGLPPREVEEQEREEERVPSVPLESEDEDEAEETELLVEERVQEHRREVVEAAPSQGVAATYNYQFLTERDFRGFIREPEAMTVLVEKSFVPPPPATVQPERRAVEVAPRGGGFLTETDFRTVDEPGVCESVASSGNKTPSWSRKPASPPSYVFESVASSGKRMPSRTRKPEQSPSVASRGSAVGGRMSFASEFSGFGDSDSESSASDGYSVKELVVDSDSDWFLSEKDFPVAARDAVTRRSYEAKVLKAIEALEAAAKLEQSYENSATTLSPSSVRQGSPNSIPDGSVKYPENMWCRSPSPDMEYKDDEEKVATETKAAEETNMKEEESVDTRDHESSSGKKVTVALGCAAASVADRGFDHSEKETITVNDHSGSDLQRSPRTVSERSFTVSSNRVDSPDARRSTEPGESVSDVQRNPEAVYERGSDVSSGQVDGPDGRRSPDPSEHEFVGTTIHSLGHISDGRRETASESYQSYEIVFYDKRRPEPLDTEYLGMNDQSHDLISDVWKGIASRNDQPCAVATDDKGGLDPADKEFVGANDHPNELISAEKKVTFNTTDNQEYAVVSGDKRTPETPERGFSENEHPYGMFPDAEYNLEYREEAEQASANDHSDNFAREAYISASGKAKMHDDGKDPEVKWKDLTEEEEDELESLWEHQELIEQLKLELKKVRSIGLPTILEESETPKASMEDLKPWRMDAKFLREDPMDELNKFFKSYMERMRKFDILCYQKMYAIDFLQLRGSKQSISMKSLSPTVASILSHNFRPSRRRSPDDPSERFLKELRYDLETVYVGQMCLSWEFLRWQYEQAYDLPESDPYHSHHYNQVAGEFQQFHVVVQRFVEDGSFKGPRLPNYINNRCVLRNLLQVPVIKEDSLKDRMEDQRKGNYVITSEDLDGVTLEEIMKEALHVLWDFIKADKVETTSVLKNLSNTHVELQDPSDHDLMMHIHAALQKKEKRLKDLLRTGNCIVKKFKKPKEDRTNQNLFFSQVDMRLIARVLRMPRITSDQLQWCKAKLDKIILVDRVRIHREPSFLLFPC